MATRGLEKTLGLWEGPRMCRKIDKLREEHLDLRATHRGLSVVGNAMGTTQEPKREEGVCGKVRPAGRTRS